MLENQRYEISRGWGPPPPGGLSPWPPRSLIGTLCLCELPRVILCDQRLLGATVKTTDVVQPYNFPFKETNQEPERPRGFPKIIQQVQGLARV